jgi:putative intracellular protease/amidase
MLMMFADSGRGVAIMANSENGILVGDYLIENIAREYGWESYVPPDRPRLGAGTVLMAVARSQSTDAAMQAYHELKRMKPGRWAPDRESLNSLVYWLRGEQHLDDALRIAKLSVEEYPNHWNAYDTLAEMYAQAAERSLAIRNYEKAIALNPKNEAGMRALESLRAAEAEGGSAQAKKAYVCPPCGLDCDKLTFDRPGVCPQCGMTLIEKTEGKPLSVAILLFDGAEIIDYTGPWEVFGQARFSVHTVGLKTEPIKTVFGQRVIPDYTLGNSPKADILLIPGGDVSDRLMANGKVIEWIRASAKDAKYVMSVCTGAFLLAKAGLLDGQTATTFHRSIDDLARFAPKARILYDQRFVDNGKVITTAGLTSGIDGALHVVAKIKGKGFAQATALGLEYHWEPESNYARAAFADRYLPRFHGLEAEVLAVAGDRDHWERRALVSAPDSALKIAELIGQQIVSSTPHAGSPVTLVPAPAKNSEERAEIEWRFTDDEGRRWRGVAVAEPSREEKGKYIVTMRLGRA